MLGVNDGRVSTASLIVGVTASSAAAGEILVAGTAGLVAGATSMAFGEDVSLSSLSDIEQGEFAWKWGEFKVDRVPPASARRLSYARAPHT